MAIILALDVEVPFEIATQIANDPTVKRRVQEYLQTALTVRFEREKNLIEADSTVGEEDDFVFNHLLKDDAVPDGV
jgi:bacterioferritin (cytochrome b1)